MKKFKFKLQPVLGHRQRIENGLKKELADSQRVLDRENKLLNQLNIDKTACKGKLVDEQQKKIDIGELKEYGLYLNRLDNEITEKKNVVEAHSEKVEIKRDELINASKEKKVIEQLKEKKIGDHMKEVLIEEQKLIDEVGITRYKSRVNSGVDK